MQNKNDWFAQYPPLQLKEETQIAEQVEKRVLRRIAESSQPTESEVLPMKQKSKLRRIRPIIFAAAAVAVGAVSLVTANAATGGEIFSKLSLYINGEKQDYDADLVSQDGDDLTYKVKDKNGNEFTYEENSNSVMVKSDGDTQGDVEIEVDGSVPSAD